ncbi:MAG: glutathione S-transferase family protein [Hyphomicrobiales bacterium]|nr:glutathione S-transferase family protein [Hyphomicrobiales bacterium]
MGLLINGQWFDHGYDTATTGGAFVRAPTSFRQQISADGAFPPQAGRYHLFVSRACPWAHRTLILRALKRLEAVISVSVVDPLMLAEGWTFTPADPLTGAKRLYEVYLQNDANASGRVTVPVLWDKQTGRIVNNESAEIIRILNHAFDGFTDMRHDFAPPQLLGDIDKINARVYEDINNGVYKAGFATAQAPYDHAVATLFAALDWADALLADHDYLVGDTLTEADIRLFTTLIRFDKVYHGHFKCNWRHAYEYPHLWRLVRRIYNLPGVADTVDFAQITQHYYGSHKTINPTGVVPRGPELDLRPL